MHLRKVILVRKTQMLKMQKNAGNVEPVSRCVTLSIASDNLPPNWSKCYKVDPCSDPILSYSYISSIDFDTVAPSSSHLQEATTLTLFQNLEVAHKTT